MTARKITNRTAKSSLVRKRRQARQQSNSLNFETLEQRQLLAAITVSNTTDTLSALADLSSIAALVASDGGDGISLREAVRAANNTAGEDTITFDANVFTGGEESVIRLTRDELQISESLSIDGSSVGGVVISGDAAGNDITFPDTQITDVTRNSSFSATSFRDNSRVLDFSATSGDLTLTSLTISGGRLTDENDSGAGIRSFGDLILINSTVSGNSTTGVSGLGAGIYISGGDLSVANSVISENRTSGSNANGGGIASSDSNVSLNNSTVSGNSGFSGAGIYSTNGGVLLTNSTVSRNIAEGTGGGINVLEGNISLTNSTVSGNSTTSSGRGGGISSIDSTLQILSSTVTDNATAQSEGGGVSFYVNSSQTAPVALVVRNSIVADNTSNGGSLGDANDLFVRDLPNSNNLTVEYSLLGDSEGSTVTTSTGTGNILNQPALLIPLSNYGGTTQTHALQLKSPAIDAGSNALAVDETGNLLTTDQRGGIRILGTVDIGAFELGDGTEFETSSLVVTTSEDVVDPMDGLTSLREAVRFANDPDVGVNNDGDADGDGSDADLIIFDASVFRGGDNNLIRLTRGELDITQSASIDGRLVGGVVITGDADNDDITLPGTDITDVEASFGGFSGVPDDLLDDNSRVLDFSAGSGNLILQGLTITGGRITESYTSGGGIRNSGNLSLIDSSVSGNSSFGLYSNGGGIYSSNGGVLLTNSVIRANSAMRNNSDGGGVFISGGDLSLIDSTVSDNSTRGDENRGGGIFVSSGNAFLSNSTVSGNIAINNPPTSSGNNRGGGIYIVNGDVSLTDSVVSGNNSFRSSGGGIYSSTGNVFLTNSTISENDSDGRRGAGIASSNSNVFITSSTISGNIGGGISNRDGNLSLINSTISGNGSANGGGIFSLNSTVQIISSTVTANISSSEAGGISFIVNSAGAAGLLIQNSIVAGNSTISTSSNAIPELLIQDRSYIYDIVVEYSLIGDTTRSGIMNASGIGNILNTSALLGPLADNGGPTQTHALLPDSPAINTGDDSLVVDANGNPLTIDQRGENRFFGVVDMGAFEFQAEGTTETRSLVVTTNQDDEDPEDGVTSLREAIAFANDPTAGRGRDGDIDGDGSVSDAITFDPAVFTGGGNNLIRLTQGELVITQSASIDASLVGGVLLTGDADDDDITTGDTDITDVSASFGGIAGAANDLLDDNSRVIDFQGPFPDRALSLIGLTITGGRATASSVYGTGNGGGVNAVGDLSLTDSTVSGNSSSGFGGGIRVNDGDFTLVDSIVSGNSSDGRGGGVSADDGNATLTNSTVSENSGSIGGGIFFGGSYDVLSLNNSTVSSNSSTGSGGGILANGRFANVLLTDSTVSDNQIIGTQGYFLGGGGIYSFFSDVTLVGSTVSGNSSTGTGGGIELFFGGNDLLLENSTVSGNSSIGGGGGIRTSSGAVSLTNSTVSGNSSNDSGGGILADSLDVALTNSTVTGNSAFVSGGGIALRASGNFGEAPTLHNSIVAGNASNGAGPDLSSNGAVSDLVVENSLIGDTTGSGITFTSGTGNFLNQPARLGPLADNGGPTQTHALLLGSPAVDGGNNALAVDMSGNTLTTDQRGEERFVFGTVDIGAFESVTEPVLEVASLVVTTRQDFENPFDGITSLREAILFANDPTAGVNNDGDADGDGRSEDTITFDASVFTASDNNLIRLTLGELFVSDGLTVDATSVGGVVITGDANGDDVTVVGTQVTDVAASFGGTAGAVNDLLDDNSRVLNFSAETGDLTLVGSTISGGRVSGILDDGGGIRFNSSGTLRLLQSDVSGNSTTGLLGFGGGISSASGDVFLTDSTVSGNSTTGGAGDGGGIRTGSGDLTLADSIVSGNNSAREGGGISSGSGDVLLTDSSVSENRTTGITGFGGGISSESGVVLLASSTISGNRVTRTNVDGGGIHASTGEVELFNSTVSGNSTSGDGGGISVADATVRLVNSTVTDNSAFGVGGGISAVAGDASAGFATLHNSIVAGNRDVGTAPDVNVSGDLVVESSLIGDTTGSGITAMTGIGNFLDQPALLGPLADNGGPTQTHALLPGSPAIDAGDDALAVDANGPLTSDQRGSAVNRSLDASTAPGTGVDIGAFELQTLLVDNPTDEDNSNVTAGDLSLREAIGLSNGVALIDVITFDENVFTGGDSNLIRLTQGELVVTGDLNIDGTSVGGVVITGDANNDDVTLVDTNITDVSASSGLFPEASIDLLDDNSRVLNFSATTGDLVITGLTITGGQPASLVSELGGGGIRFASNGVLTVTDSAISGNRDTSSVNAAGGISSAYSGTIYLNNSTVSDNVGSSGRAGARGGGGIFVSSGLVSLTGSTVSGNDNNSSFGGGGISTLTGGVLLSNSTISGNSSGNTNGSGGGGIDTYSGDISVINSTISGNSVTLGSGGIRTGSGDVAITNSTISGNSSRTNRGGGIGVDSGNVSLTNSTIFENIGVGVSFTGTGSGSNTPFLTINNSIVAGNLQANNSGISTPQDLALGSSLRLSIGHSLIGAGETISGGVGNLIGTAASPLDPLLGPLSDNGGPTLTHNLLQGSPAIDAGSDALAVNEDRDPLTVDQLGASRFVGTVDIGAVESDLEDRFLLGDANLDGSVNFLDISPFVSLLTSNTFLDEADIDRNGVVNFLDIGPFVEVISSGGPVGPVLLGDANVNGEVNFLDIPAFVSVITTSTFLDEADINRDGEVNFLDISPFVDVVSSIGSLAVSVSR